VLARLALWPASVLYGRVTRWRVEAYRRGWLRTVRLPVPVVSVGNLTVGGTGKTPLVAAIATMLEASGRRVAIVSRGYGRSGGEVRVVSLGDGSGPRLGAREAGDEPLLLAESLPRCVVVVGADRAEAGRVAIESGGADVIVADDAFQHLRLERTLNLLAVDATNPFAAGWLLPAGGLREPVAAARRADAVIVTRCDRIGETINLEAQLRRLRPGLPFFHAITRPLLLRGPGGASAPLEAIAGQKVAAFSGIARPRFLVQDLERAGARVVAFLPFEDHHWYRDGDLETIARRAREAGAERLITTHKDLVRLAPAQREALSVWWLEVGVEYWDDRRFRQFLAGRVGQEAAA
jgi:tetraacyldisaccharide 4'-kinase